MVWLGFRALARYENTPGASGRVPDFWPAESLLARAVDQPTLVLFVHPHCPCSRATIGELAQLMADAQGKVRAQVVFLQPQHAGDDWAQTELWHSAAEIPGVTVSADLDGVEASRFGAETSGHAFLFHPAGWWLFDGGITASRGHAGPSEGRSAIQSLLERTTSMPARTRVFGCSLRDPQQASNEHECSSEPKN
ncbi:MAG TPA: hypothetical protein VG095_07215 [Chthoniobacterales bacterium]|nr:hypothetical protein [Chthoniobacterales bacterium]